jgi:hypothetical protein
MLPIKKLSINCGLSFYDLFRKKYTKIAQVISGRSCFDRIAELLEERVGITSQQIIIRIKSH